VCLHNIPPSWLSCLLVSGRLPCVTCLDGLYALVHYTGAHPCPSRSTLVPLRLSVARPTVPPHMLAPSRACEMCHTPDSRAHAHPWPHAWTASVRLRVHRSILASVRAAWPPRPCARSPSRDVRRPSNLPAHHSTLSRCQRQACFPCLTHTTDSDQVVRRPICPAPSCICSLMFEPVSSVHPTALLPLHRHTNVVRQALSHLWPTLHALMCLCVAPVLAPHACTRALHRAARSSSLLPRAHAPGHNQHVAAPDDRTRANSHVVAISACTPNHPPAPLNRSSAHAEVPCLVSLSFPSASLRCDSQKTVVALTFILSHKK
jgi:hypothetical protein